MDLRLRAPKALHGTIRLPASKSISNRMLLLRVLSGGKIALHNISDCDDTRAMELGVRSEKIVNSKLSNSKCIDVGAAGTAMRFLTAYFASTPCDVVITGSERMRHRPIGVLVEALRSLGADISYEGEEGFPPLHIKGRPLDGGTLRMAGSVSSQYVSALLMVAPTMRQGLTLTLEGDIISRPYINMTVSLMRRFGITVEEPDDTTFRVAPGEYSGSDYTIENDWSAASYWYEMLALADEGEVVLEGLFEDSLQGDSCVRHLFEPLGVSTEFNERGAVIQKKDPPLYPSLVWRGVYADFPDLWHSPYTGERGGGLGLSLSECPDLAQTMVATCCGMGVPFRFSGLQSLRIKETDRLLALRQELGKLGYDVREEEDGVLESSLLTPHSSLLTPNSIATYDDHRMAMCMAPLAILHDGLVINDAQVVSKSYPTFWEDLKSVGYAIEQL